MSESTDRKREEQQQMLKNRVFEEACRILRKRGIEALTIQALADATGTSKGALYNCLGNKREILLFISERFYEKVAIEMDLLLFQETDCLKALRKLIRTGLLNMAEFRFLEFSIIEMLSSLTKTGEEKPFCDGHERLIRDVLTRFFKRGIEQGAFRGSSPELMGIILCSFLDSLDVRVLSRQNWNIKDPALLDRIADTLMYGFCTPTD